MYNVYINSEVKAKQRQTSPGQLYNSCPGWDACALYIGVCGCFIVIIVVKASPPTYSLVCGNVCVIDGAVQTDGV